MILILIFLSIAFFTIIERKILGSIHIRLGPRKVGIIGIFQPFSDALKLFSKNLNFISKNNEFYWNFSPIITFFIFIVLCIFLPIKIENNILIFRIIILIFILGLPNYSIFWTSFFSFRKFRIIRSKRCVCQIISYEIGLIFFFICLFFLFNNINLEFLIIFLSNLNNFNKILLLLILWILILRESRRIPFDFVEGESELVSGFNIEYSRVYFSLFFIYEYGIMLFFSILFSILITNFIISVILIFAFILARSCFVRIRYDQIIILIWKFIYPLIIPFIIFLNYF